MGVDPVPDTIELIRCKDEAWAYALILTNDHYETIEKENYKSQQKGHTSHLRER